MRRWPFECQTGSGDDYCGNSEFTAFLVEIEDEDGNMWLRHELVCTKCQTRYPTGATFMAALPIRADGRRRSEP